MNRKTLTSEKLFYRLINNKTESTYWPNLRELRSRVNSEVFEKSYQLAQSSKPSERRIGVDVLAQFGIGEPRPYYKETIALYWRLLETETEPSVITSLIYGIGWNNQDMKGEGISALAKFKNHRSTNSWFDTKRN